MPGTFNRQYPATPLVRVLSHHGRRYALAAITEPLSDLPLFGAAAAQASLRSTEARAAVGPIPLASVLELERLPLTTTARRILQGERPKRRPDGGVDRSASLLQMARILHGAGVDPHHIAQVLAERDEALGWRKYTDRPDAAKQYERIVAYVTR